MIVGEGGADRKRRKRRRRERSEDGSDQENVNDRNEERRRRRKERREKKASKGKERKPQSQVEKPSKQKGKFVSKEFISSSSGSSSEDDGPSGPRLVIDDVNESGSENEAGIIRFLHTKILDP